LHPEEAVSPRQALAFVERHGVVLQAARGPVPSLAEAVAGGPIRGSWWGHAKGGEIFRAADAVSESPDVLVCKLLEGKVTYVHRRLWAPLVKLSRRFKKAQLAKIWEEHTSTGAHRSRRKAFPSWVPAGTRKAASRLTVSEAERLLAPWPALAGPPRVRMRRARRQPSARR
jgi:hypothetical protein